MKKNMQLHDELAVIDWMKDHMQELIDNRPTYEQLLKMLNANGGAFLAMDLTTSKVKRIAQNLEINLGKSFLPGKSGGGTAQRQRRDLILELLCV